MGWSISKLQKRAREKNSDHLLCNLYVAVAVRRWMIESKEAAADVACDDEWLLRGRRNLARDLRQQLGKLSSFQPS